MNAKERWEALRDNVDQVLDSIENKTEKKVDEAKLKASLAKLEAKEIINPDDYRQDLVRLGDSFKEEWYGTLAKLDERVVDFINKFPLK